MLLLNFKIQSTYIQVVHLKAQQNTIYINLYRVLEILFKYSRSSSPQRMSFEHSGFLDDFVVKQEFCLMNVENWDALHREVRHRLVPRRRTGFVPDKYILIYFFATFIINIIINYVGKMIKCYYLKDFHKL